MNTAALRATIALVVETAVIYLVWPIAEEVQWGSALYIVYIGSSVMGILIGLLVAHDLVNSGGLAGRSIMLPVLIVLAVATLIAYHLAGMLRGGPSSPLIYSFAINLGVCSVLGGCGSLALQ